MAFSADVASVLESLGMGVWGGGTTAGATIATNHEPDAPAAVTTVYVVGGPMDMLTYDGNTNGERPAQIRMRDPDPVALETRIESLYTLWSAWKSYPTYFLRVKASGKPMFNYPSQDSNVGSLFIASFNIQVIRGS